MFIDHSLGDNHGFGMSAFWRCFFWVPHEFESPGGGGMLVEHPNLSVHLRRCAAAAVCSTRAPRWTSYTAARGAKHEAPGAFPLASHWQGCP